MSKLSLLVAGAAVVLNATLAFQASADDQGGRGGGSRGGMPPHGFHGAPPSFGGALPRGGATPAPGRFSVGRPGHDLGVFNGRDFAHFSPQDRSLWQGGAWRHVMHNGYLGWWWVIGDSWFYYPAPIYPYPLYVGPEYYYDYYSYYPAPSYYWYHCEDPLGYYPNVQMCNVPWEAVPPAP